MSEAETNPLDYEMADLVVSIRLDNVLRNENILTLRDLAGLTEQQLLRMPNFGRRMLREVCDLLKQFGLSLRQPEESVAANTEVEIERAIYKRAARNGEFAIAYALLQCAYAVAGSAQHGKSRDAVTDAVEALKPGSAA